MADGSTPKNARYESDNPQFDHLINNMDSGPAPRVALSAPLDEQLQTALEAAGFDETDVQNAVEAIMPVLRRRLGGSRV